MGKVKKVLVIGAGGFVGPWVCRALGAAGCIVVGLSRRLPQHPGGAFEFTGIVGDAREPATYASAVEDVDAVVFNAAYLPRNYSDPAEAENCLKTNAIAPLELLRRLTECPKPFIYMSSAQGYVAGEG